VREGAGGHRRAFSGTVWEARAGFARAIREGDRVLVSGTTATHGTRLIGGTDAEAQAHAVIDKVAGALRSLGATLEDVVRTRLFVARAEDAAAVTRAHGRRFGEIQPANTLVLAGLVGDGYLVEMEAEAVVAPRPTTRRVPL
jgi:enamine deaminase RidA (YjgF/YER057c/UK114 family)